MKKLNQIKTIKQLSLKNQSKISFSSINTSYDPIYSKYKEEPEDSDCNLSSLNKGTETYKNAGLQIGNSIMGAGILSIPIVMRNLGILLGIFFISFIAIVTIYSVDLLIK